MKVQKFYIEDIPEARYKDFIRRCAEKILNITLENDFNFKNDLLQYGYGNKFDTNNKIHLEVKSKDLSKKEILSTSYARTGQIYRHRQDVKRTIVFIPYYIEEYEKENYKKSVLNDTKNKLQIEIWDNQTIDDIVEEFSGLIHDEIIWINNWFDAYGIIADKLNKVYLRIPQDERMNPGTYFFKFFYNSDFSKDVEERYFKGGSEGNRESLDPVQLFASFNYSNVDIEKRVNIILSILNVLGSLYRVDFHTNFNGIPTPITTSIGRIRKQIDQNEIWEAFSQVISENTIARDYFRQLPNWEGLDVPSFTIFLFWIDSSRFIPFDQNTSNYLSDLGLMKTRPKSFKEYLDFCLRISVKKDSIRRIVNEAYKSKKPSESAQIISGATSSIVYKETGADEENTKRDFEAKRKERSKGFQLIAVRPTKNQKHLKNLKVNQIYSFNKAYDFTEENEGRILYDSSNEIKLYSISNSKLKREINISLSAVVGMNGSGKSSLIELILLSINRISKVKLDNEDKLIAEEVYVDLFFRSSGIFKLSIGKNIELYKYVLLEDKGFYNILKPPVQKSYIDVFNEFDLQDFCYTLGVNYSLYGLNSVHMGEWIDPLFHKNDSYQIPVVLNPKRDFGNIDVNNEEYLAKSRLLSNVLDYEIISNNGNKVPEIVPQSVPEFLDINYDKEKIERKIENYVNKYNTRPEETDIELLLTILECDQDSPNILKDEARIYLFLKVVDIVDWYTDYKDFKGMPNWIKKKTKASELKLRRLRNKLLSDFSHITFKVRQTINFLKHDLYNLGTVNGIQLLSAEINEHLKGKDRVIHFAPPPFLSTNLIFNNGGDFNHLSSGEKQLILSINTVGYHIFNLESVLDQVEQNKYNSVNLIFDEVELYFHPDMQRHFINNLLNRIESLKLEYINNISILFITHSPFILSDIPRQNVLHLERVNNLSIPAQIKDETFGANIHKLLSNDFFLKNGFMGEYAKLKIKDLLVYLKHDESKRTSKVKNPKSKRNWTQNEARIFIDLVGELVVKKSLKALYDSKFITNKNLDMKTRKEYLETELALLNSEENTSK